MNCVRREKVPRETTQFSFSNCNYIVTAEKFKSLIFGSRESASKSISIPENCFEVNTGAAGKFLVWLSNFHGRGRGSRSSVAFGRS